MTTVEKPIDYLTLYGDEFPLVPDDAGIETTCPIVGRCCCCWDGECKNPQGQCDGE